MSAFTFLGMSTGWKPFLFGWCEDLMEKNFKGWCFASPPYPPLYCHDQWFYISFSSMAVEYGLNVVGTSVMITQVHVAWKHTGLFLGNGFAWISQHCNFVALKAYWGCRLKKNKKTKKHLPKFKCRWILFLVSLLYILLWVDKVICIHSHDNSRH